MLANDTYQSSENPTNRMHDYISSVNEFLSVWMILGRTPGGFIIANQYLPQQPTLSDMTKTDLNFALKIEQMFRRIAHPEYRQVTVEVSLLY